MFRLISALTILLVVACTKPAGEVPFQGINTGIFGLDREEGILLYNGPDKSPSQEELRIDGDVIRFPQLPDSLGLGEPIPAEWRDAPYRFYRSELPLLRLDVRAGVEPGADYRSAHYTLVDGGTVTAEGLAAIRLRGNTSLEFPKKSYRLELREEDGTSIRDESLLGMRSDDDWLLDGMWNEPLAIRDMSAMEWWLGFGRVHYQDEEPEVQLGADRRYCELFINDRYRGLYYLGERLDRKQLKLAFHRGPGTGGELYKAQGWGEAVGGFTLPPVDNDNLRWGNYEVKYPTEPGTFDWQKLREFVALFKDGTNERIARKMSATVDVDNLVDYFIFTNQLDAFDNQGNNVFIARRNPDSPYYFVSWDFDATLGIGISGQPTVYSDEMLTHLVTGRLLGVPGFREALKERWQQVGNRQIWLEGIFNVYQRNHNLLLRNRIYEREATVAGLERPLPDPAALADLERVLRNRSAAVDDFIFGL
jgi:hypothetical protein